MEAPVESGGAVVECPQCGTQFVVEVPVVPVVKARAVTTPVQRAQPQAPRVPRPPAPAMPAARPAKAAKESTMLFAGLGGACVLLIALVVWFNIQARKVVNQAPPPAEEVSAMTRAIPPKPEPPAPEPETPEEARMSRELKKIKEALAATEAKEKERAQREARRVDEAKEAALAERQAEMEYARDLLASNFFQGDTAAAEAFLKVYEDVQWGISNLMTDSDPSNDLKTKEDFEEYMTQRLLVRFEKNEVLNNWIKEHRREPRKLIQELLRTQPKRSATGPAATKAFDFTKYASVGSGFWISADGWILTNEHVVSDSKMVDLRLRDGRVIQATVVKTDEAKDLALLKADHAPRSWQAVSKGVTDLPLGRTVFTVGYPDPMIQGVEPKFTDGRVSAASGIEDRKDNYQTTVPVQHGNSGGALVDFDTGWVVGVVNAKLIGSNGVSADNVSYAIKGSVVSSFFESVPEAKAAAAKVAPQPLPKGSEREVIDRATKSSVLILRPR
jgi:S1-C subfamily serine protease